MRFSLPWRRKRPHSCRYDSDEGLLYNERGLVILRCACGHIRMFGRWA